MILDRLKAMLPEVLTAETRERLREATSVNSAGYDPWGLNLDTAELTMRCTSWLYTHYFRCDTRGTENVPEGRVFLVGNHCCQLPFDGMLVAMAMILDAHPPRLVRGMVERWMPSLPFVSTLFNRCGQVVGDPENCRELLEREQAIMVFPEGVRGSGKTWWNRYQLQGFGTGFVRLALEANAPIVPVAIVGGEEVYPSLYDAKWLAKLFGAPYAPITPLWPWFGPVGAVPLPVKMQIRFGEPLRFEGDPDAADHEIQDKVDRVKRSIQSMIDTALAERPVLSALGSLPGVGK